MVGSTEEECIFAIVQQVTIQKVDDENVTFTTRSAGSTRNSDQNLRRTFTVPATEVYIKPIDGAPPSVAMIPGATGPLFLSRTGWQTTTPDGFKIHGGEQAVFKWPLCAAIATPLLTKLTVIPSSIVVRGHLEDETMLFDLELFGSDAAASQDITWNGVDDIELRLTQSGAQRLRVKARSTTVKMWPTRITVKGSPAIDQAVLGEVDVLDSELAAGAQHISFAKPGAPITLLLTQDGVNAFHVTPQAVAELSSDIGLVSLPTAAVKRSGHGSAEHRLSGVTRRRSPG